MPYIGVYACMVGLGVGSSSIVQFLTLQLDRPTADALAIALSYCEAAGHRILAHSLVFVAFW